MLPYAKDVIKLVERLRTHATDNIASMQSGLVPKFLLTRWNVVDYYVYDNKRYDNYDDDVAFIKLDNVKYKLDNGRKDQLVFKESAFTAAGENNRMYPFVFFINGQHIPWSDITVVRELKYSYFEVKNVARFGEITDVQMIHIPFACKYTEKREYDENDTVLFRFNDAGLTAPHGYYVYTTNLKDLVFRQGSHLAGAKVEFEDLNIDAEYKINSDEFFVFCNKKLVRDMPIKVYNLNVLTLNDGQPLEEDTEYRIFFRAVVNPNISNITIPDNTSYIKSILTRQEDAGNLEISTFERDFNFNFDISKGSEVNFNDAIKYLHSYRQFLLNPVYEGRSVVRTLQYTGKEIKEKLDDKHRLRMLRWKYEGRGDCFVMVFKNNLLHENYIDLHYEANSWIMPITEEIDDQDIYEIVFFRFCNNYVVERTMPADGNFILKEPFSPDEVEFASLYVPDQIHGLSPNDRTRYPIEFTVEQDPDDDWTTRVHFTDNAYFETPENPIIPTYTLNFRRDIYNTVTVNDIALSGNTMTVEQGPVDIKITPTDGWMIVDCRIDGNIVATIDDPKMEVEYHIDELNHDIDIIITTANARRSLTVTPDENTNITVNGNLIEEFSVLYFNYNDEVSINVELKDPDNWFLDDVRLGTVSIADNLPYTFNIKESTYLMVSTSEDIGVRTLTLDLDYNAVDVTLNGAAVDTRSIRVEIGAIVNLEITPKGYYSITEIRKDGQVVTSPIIFTMGRNDTTVSVTTHIDRYTITIDPFEHAQLTFNGEVVYPGQELTYNKGTEILIDVEVESGYYLGNININGTYIIPPYTWTVLADGELNIVTGLISTNYMVTLNTAVGCRVEFNDVEVTAGSYPYRENSIIKLEAYPTDDDEFTITEILVNGAKVNNGSMISIVADTIITVNTDYIATQALTINVGEGIRLSINDQMYENGTFNVKWLSGDVVHVTAEDLTSSGKGLAVEWGDATYSNRNGAVSFSTTVTDPITITARYTGAYITVDSTNAIITINGAIVAPNVEYEYAIGTKIVLDVSSGLADNEHIDFYANNVLIEEDVSDDTHWFIIEADTHITFDRYIQYPILLVNASVYTIEGAVMRINDEAANLGTEASPEDYNYRLNTPITIDYVPEDPTLVVDYAEIIVDNAPGQVIDFPYTFEITNTTRIRVYFNRDISTTDSISSFVRARRSALMAMPYANGDEEDYPVATEVTITPEPDPGIVITMDGTPITQPVIVTRDQLLTFQATYNDSTENTVMQIDYTKTTDEYLGKPITIFSKNQFRYFSYRLTNITGKRCMFGLSPEFKTCLDPERYMVFINGRMLTKNMYRLLLPDKDNAFLEPCIHTRVMCEPGDRFEAFYLPCGCAYIDIGDSQQTDIVKVTATTDNQPMFTIPFPFANYLYGKNSFVVIKGTLIVDPSRYNVIGNKLTFIDPEDYLEKGRDLTFIFFYSRASTVGELDFVTEADHVLIETKYEIADVEQQKEFAIPYPEDSRFDRGLNPFFLVYRGLYINESRYVVENGHIRFTGTDDYIDRGSALIFVFFYSQNTTAVTTETIHITASEEDQRVFTVPLPYENYFKDNNKFFVTMNGTFLTNDEDYVVDTNESTITLATQEGLNEGEELIVTMSYANNYAVKSTMVEITATEENQLVFNLPEVFTAYQEIGNKFFVITDTTFVDPRRYEISDGQLRFVYDYDAQPIGAKLSFLIIYTENVENASSTASDYSVANKYAKMETIPVVATEDGQKTFTIPKEDALIFNKKFFITIGSTFLDDSLYTKNTLNNTITLSDELEGVELGREVLFTFIDSDYLVIEHEYEEVYAEVDGQTEFDIPLPFDNYLELGNKVLVFYGRTFMDPDRYIIDETTNRIRLIDMNDALKAGRKLVFMFLYIANQANSSSDRDDINAVKMQEYGYIYVTKSNLHYALDKKLYFLFINGKKVDLESIEDVAANIIRLRRDLQSRYNVCIIDYTPEVEDFAPFVRILSEYDQIINRLEYDQLDTLFNIYTKISGTEVDFDPNITQEAIIYDIVRYHYVAQGISEALPFLYTYDHGPIKTVDEYGNYIIHALDATTSNNPDYDHYLN